MENQEAKFKNPILLKISGYIGLIAFIGGWLIFLSWAAARYLAAKDIEELEFIGIIWMILFFWLSLLALILLLVYVAKNQQKHHWKMLFTALMILINIPSVALIVVLFSTIENKSFINLSNQSEIEIMEVELNGNNNSWNIGKIRKGTSIIFNFEPFTFENNAQSYQLPDNFYLVIKHSGTQDTIQLPSFYGGDCKDVTIGQNLKIKNEK